jgi:hypothetical protein
LPIIELDSNVKKRILSLVEGVVGGAWRADEKAFACHNRSDEFHMVAMQIINEEEKKKYVVFADSLGKTL